MDPLEYPIVVQPGANCQEPTVVWNNGYRDVKVARTSLADIRNRPSLPKYGGPHTAVQMLLGAKYFESFDELYGLDSWSASICVRSMQENEEETGRICWDFNVPTISDQTCGLVASIRTHIREHSGPSINLTSKLAFPPPPPLFSNSNPFRLSRRSKIDFSFPCLLEFVKTFDIDKMDDHEHAHVSAVHDGNLPQDSAQREELKTMILANKRNEDEDNFDGAVGMVPAHVEELFHSSHCDKVPWYDGTFWVLVASLREFVKRNPSHQLPLSGVLPDIKSDTQQALEDFETFKDIMYDVRDSLDELPSDDDTDYHTELGHGHEPPDTSISPEMLESFFEEECQPGNEEYIATWYLAFQALPAYRSSKKGEYPGMRKGEEEADIEILSPTVLNNLSDHGWEKQGDKLPEKMQKALREMVRSSACELPHIASLVGGLVSQEVIKIITKQFIPMNGVLIFDRYRTTTGILEF
ncbi:hypothetical protein PSTG_09287 [Puccinia striiformis f. sp. tritici PST-78]|uniref:NEDD8-activating enzyme E1 regulatory subunit n=1 Tax=Puccinia striiformis f. sp. tritici PST-78 TaxID=1165861 RepID=A0A0L0VER6_9BASI|nr:hypothetical protein PSTG_09287 [Puccinia striiformis f. sp. tritici PST-78]